MKIEKLPEVTPLSHYYETPKAQTEKINELIDLVNYQQEVIEELIQIIQYMRIHTGL